MQLDNEWYLAVVNKASDEVAKALGSTLSTPQIAYLKSVVCLLAPLSTSQKSAQESRGCLTQLQAAVECASPNRNESFDTLH